jgi:hypothetical protein
VHLTNPIYEDPWINLLIEKPIKLLEKKYSKRSSILRELLAKMSPFFANKCLKKPLVKTGPFFANRLQKYPS